MEAKQCLQNWGKSMDSILKGDIPATLSLKRLKKGIPLDWNE